MLKSTQHQIQRCSLEDDSHVMYLVLSWKRFNATDLPSPVLAMSGPHVDLGVIFQMLGRERETQTQNILHSF